jgi:trehalose utilization protein
MPLRILVWNEFVHEKTDDAVRAHYPDGIHACLARALAEHPLLAGAEIRTATLDDPDCGVSDETLSSTDVLAWWGHMAHHRVPDDAAERVADHVRRGMGLLALHSAHFAKPFRRLMGTSCALKWRDGDRERIWTVLPGHPIAEGVPEHFELAEEEMYGEPFDIPAPDELVFLSWFAGGEVMRSGCVFRRGRGKVFYFRPGHETNPTYHDPNVRRILGNAAAYVAPTSRSGPLEAPKAEVLEPKR